MRKKAAALLCLLTITVSAFALDIKPEVRRDFRLGISNPAWTNNLCSLFHYSESSISFRTAVRTLDLGLGIFRGRAESFYNFSTFTGSGDFTAAGLQFLLGMKYGRFELEACAGLCTLFRGNLSSGFRTLVRADLCPVIAKAKAGNLCFALGMPLGTAFNASESMFTAGISIKVCATGEDK